MKKILNGLLVTCLLLSPALSSGSQVSVGISLPNISIGLNLPFFPQLVPVPGYPVYYSPQVDANYFFYDGMYWVYSDDNWYASSWYNGPWSYVAPEVVPLFILRIPVRYYRQPPVYFRGWHSHAPPRWGQHWGRDWERRRSGWDRWQRGNSPARAPLPVYQRQYSGERYPRLEQQHELRKREYSYEPRNKVVRQHFQQQVDKNMPAPAQRGRQEPPPLKNPKQQEYQHSSPDHKGGMADPRMQPVQRRNDSMQRQEPYQPPSQQRPPAVREQHQTPAPAYNEQRAPEVQGRENRSPDRPEPQDSNRHRGQGQRMEDGRGRQ